MQYSYIIFKYAQDLLSLLRLTIAAINSLLFPFYHPFAASGIFSSERYFRKLLECQQVLC